MMTILSYSSSGFILILMYELYDGNTAVIFVFAIGRPNKYVSQTRRKPLPTIFEVYPLCDHYTVIFERYA